MDLALDGAYNEDQTIYNHSPHPPNLPDIDSSISSSSNSGQLRHRHVTNSSSANEAPTNQEGDVSSTGPPSNEESQGLHVVLWNTANWLFKLPFIIVFNTLSTFYDFFATLIRPTLSNSLPCEVGVVTIALFF